MSLTVNKVWELLAALVIALAAMTAGFSGISEAAPSKELNFFQYESYIYEGREWLRIELGIQGGKADYATEVHELTSKQLHVKLADTARGKVKSDIALDKKIAKYLTMRQDDAGNLDVIISFVNNVEDQAYKIYTAEADRKGKKPYRLVVEIAADKLASEYENNTKGDGLPGLQGRRIVLDPGHGGSDSGAHGPHGLLEKDVTLAISRKVQEILTDSGAIVTMTRNTDVDVYGPLASDRNELQARVDVGKRNPGNEIFVSIHCDAFTSPTAHGTSTFYYQTSFRGQLLAQCIQDEVVAATGLTGRGAKTANFYVLKHSPMPATLVETAFISNYHEEALLGDPDFQATLAEAICKGISQYFRMR